MFHLQLRNELWKLFGKKRTYIGFGAFVSVQILMLCAFRLTRWQQDFEKLLANNGYLASEFVSALSVAFIMLMPQFWLLMPLYPTLIGGDLVAKEDEDGTLRMILCRPISRLRLLLVKWIAGMIYSTLLVLVLGLVAVAFASLVFPWNRMFVFVPGQAFSVFDPMEGLGRLAFSHLFLAVNAGAVLSIAFMFSCFNMKPAAATIVALSYLFINLVMERLPFFNRFENWFITHHFGSWLLVLQNPIPWPRIIQSELILLAICATAFVIGVTVFHVRDIKS